MSDQPFTPEQVEKALSDISNWQVDPEVTTIARTYNLNDFQDAIVFVNRVAKLAEESNHHPNIHIHEYSHVTITLSTHSIGGLSDKDFSLAGKIDVLLDQ